MAEEYDEFDYVPDDIESENDYQEKKIEQSVRENKNKDLLINDSINRQKIKTEDELYNFETINNKNIYDDNNNFDKYEDEIEEIKLDDANGELDYKYSQKNPTGRQENVDQKNDLTKNIKNISYKPLNQSNSSNNNNHQNLNISNIDANNRYYNNSIIKKDIYENTDISRLESYNNINTSNNKFNNQVGEKINLSYISQTRTPKNLSNSKHYNYMNIDNNINHIKNFDPNFGNESRISNSNKNYYSQNMVDKNKSLMDSVNNNLSPSGISGYRRGQNISHVANSFINNNSFVSYKMPSVMEMNSRLIRVGNNNLYSKLQYAEMKYEELKNYYSIIQQNFSNKKISDIENNQIIEKEKFLEFISKHNYELLKYIDNLNSIINIVISASKVPVKSQSNIKNKKFQLNVNSNINEVNNNKLLEVFKKEYIKLDNRFKQISDPSYEEKLEETLAELKDKINYYEAENKKLKITQKQSEALFERQYKNNNLNLQIKNLEINKVNIDYENTKKLNDNVLEKIQKNKIVIADNEQKTNELSEWLNKLENIARDMYGITEFLDKEDIKKIEASEKKKVDLKIALKKKTEVLEKVLITNKKKYEGEIIKNEKIIVNLEKQKIELIKQIKVKSELSRGIKKKVKQLYSQYNNNTENFNTNTENLDDNIETIEDQYSQNNQINTRLTENKSILKNKNQLLPRNDQQLENNRLINSDLEKNKITDLNYIQNLQIKPNIYDLNQNNEDKEKLKMMNGRISIENENTDNNINTNKKEVLENLGKSNKFDMEYKNNRANKPNFKFNLNLNQLNTNQNVPSLNIETKSAIQIKEEIQNNDAIIKNNIEMRESRSKPFPKILTEPKEDKNDNNNIIEINKRDFKNDTNNGSYLNNDNKRTISDNNSSNNTNNNIMNYDISNNSILNQNSRRRNVNKVNDQDEFINIDKKNISKYNDNKSVKNNNPEENNKKEDEIQINNSNGNVPSNFMNSEINNKETINDNLSEIAEANPIKNKDISTVNIDLAEKRNIKNNDKSSKSIFNLGARREKMVEKEKKKHSSKYVFR